MGALTLSSRSVEETRALGEALGRVLQDGDFVGLVGELGAGKTEFARGIASGAGVPEEEVASPSFAIVHAYRGRIPLCHADLYRLTGADDLYGTGYHELRDGPGAMMVEWLDRFPAAAPPDGLTVRIDEPAEGQRELHVRGSGPRSDQLLQRWQDELLDRVG
jgi:tRNA threonylcarbamoyladenosine biosynthesis protein TsaE